MLADFATGFALFATPQPLGPGGKLLAYAVAPALLTAGVQELRGSTNKLVLPLWSSFGTVLAVVAAAPVVVALGASLLTNGVGATLVVALASVAPRITVYAAYPASTIAGFAAALSGLVVLPTDAGRFRP